MGRYQRIFLFLLVLGLFLTPQAWAARIQMGSDSLSGKTGDDHGVTVSLTVKEGDYEGANPSQNEKAEFVVDNPRDGDRCVTNPSPSDSTGKVTGTCYASKAGSVKVYAKSTDRGDQSESVTLEFTEPDSTDAKPTDDPANPADETALQNSPTAADEAKKAAAMKAYQEQMAQGQGGQQQTAGSALASQLGLTEDKDTGMSNGLGSGSVEGASTANSNENNPRSDLDLLNSIIYLAGGIIFIIAALYFIWWQMKEHQARMEKKKNTGDGGDDGKDKPPSGSLLANTGLKSEEKKSEATQVNPEKPIEPETSKPINPQPPTSPKPETTPTEKKNETASPNIQPATPTNSQPENPTSSGARPTLAQLRNSSPSPTASAPVNPQPENPKPANPQPTSSSESNYSVDAITRRITQEVQKTNNSS